MEREPARVERAIIIAGALIAFAVWLSSGTGRYEGMQRAVLDTKTGRVCPIGSGECFEFGEEG